VTGEGIGEQEMDMSTQYSHVVLCTSLAVNRFFR